MFISKKCIIFGIFFFINWCNISAIRLREEPTHNLSEKKLTKT